MRGVALAALFGALSLVSAGCEVAPLPPAGQLVVHVDTDAPLPEEPGTTPSFVPPLFDRLSFELFLPGETVPCRGCARELEPTREGAARGALSIGVLPEGSARRDLRLRVRLYRSAGLPARSSTSPRSCSGSP